VYSSNKNDLQLFGSIRISQAIVSALFPKKLEVFAVAHPASLVAVSRVACAAPVDSDTQKSN
jgi:hypothetical protein